MTPTDTILALEKALEAGPTAKAEWVAKGSEVWVGQRRICSHVMAGESMGMGPAIERKRVNAEFIAAANPLAIRTLLDAHASALRDAARYRWLEQRFLGADFRWNADVDSGEGGCQALVFKWPGGKVWGDLSATLEAALDDNTKGAAE